MLKIKLLRDTGDFGNKLSHVNFPITVTAEYHHYYPMYVVKSSELGISGDTCFLFEFNSAEVIKDDY